MPTLRTHNLTKSYGGRTVVRGVSLDVTSGEIVGLLGPNGPSASRHPIRAVWSWTATT
jgi:ABC-type lipopolysaccharide export system ATPase subunit